MLVDKERDCLVFYSDGTIEAGQVTFNKLIKMDSGNITPSRLLLEKRVIRIEFPDADLQLYHIDLKPFSVNKAWKGQRYRTKEYKQFKQDVFDKFIVQCRDLKIVETGDLFAFFRFGLNVGDYDNPVKPFQDILCDYLSTDDRRIIGADTRKVKVKKGEEFIRFKLFSFNKKES